MRLFLIVTSLLLLSSIPGFGGEWTGYLMDTMCAAKRLDQAASHTTECMKNCSKSGFGLVTKEGKYIKFDEAGNAKALKELQRSRKEDNLLVRVTGKMKGAVIRVDSIRTE